MTSDLAIQFFIKANSFIHESCRGSTWTLVSSSLRYQMGEAWHCTRSEKRAGKQQKPAKTRTKCHFGSVAGVGIGTLVGDRLRWGLRPHTPLWWGAAPPTPPLMVGAAPPHPLKVGLWASLMAINDRDSLARKYRNLFVFAQNRFMFFDRN